MFFARSIAFINEKKLCVVTENKCHLMFTDIHYSTKKLRTAQLLRFKRYCCSKRLIVARREERREILKSEFVLNAISFSSSSLTQKRRSSCFVN